MYVQQYICFTYLIIPYLSQWRKSNRKFESNFPRQKAWKRGVEALFLTEFHYGEGFFSFGNILCRLNGNTDMCVLLINNPVIISNLNPVSSYWANYRRGLPLPQSECCPVDSEGHTNTKTLGETHVTTRRNYKSFENIECKTLEEAHASKNPFPNRKRKHRRTSFQVQWQHVLGRRYKLKKSGPRESTCAYRSATSLSLPCN